MLAQTGLTPGEIWGQIWAPVISTVLVASIGGLVTVLNARSSRNRAETAADSAQTSAESAADFVKALEAKNAVIESLEQRVEQLEHDNVRCEERCEKIEATNAEMKEQMEEMTEALRNAYLLERELNKQQGDPKPPARRRPARG